MNDPSKTNAELSEEICVLKQRIEELGQSESERKQVEALLRESEERYRALYNNTPVMLHSIDANGNLISVSEYWLNTLGYTRDEVLGRKYSEFLTETSRKYAITTVLPEFRKTGYCNNIQYQFVKKNGDVIDTLLSAISERDEHGMIVRSLAVITDIAERKRAEKAPQGSRALLKSIIESTTDAIYAKDLRGRYILCNAATGRAVGKSAEEVLGKDDLALFPRPEAQSIMEGDRRVMEGGMVKASEIALTIATGQQVTYLSTKGPLFDASGKCVGLFGVTRDITERKQAEKKLRQSEANYRSLASTVDAMWLVDRNCKYLFANENYTRRLDLTEGSVLGRKYGEFHDEEASRIFSDAVNYVYETGNPHQDEWLGKRSGKYLLRTFSPVKDTDGSITAVTIVSKDITARKQTEDALRESEQAAKRLAKENELIAEIGRIISSSLDIEEVYGRFANTVLEHIPFDRIAINTVNMKDYTRTIRYVQGDVFTGNRIGEVVSLAGTGVEQIIRTKSSMLVNNKSPADMKGKLLFAFKFGAQSTMLIPLILKDEVIGSMAIHAAQTDAYSENDLRLAERMASQVAGSIANAQLFRERTQAEQKLQITLDSLRKSMSATIQVLVSAVEARDPYTAGHQIRSADLARAIATEMGLSQDRIEGLRMAGSIHDIGKISIPAEILSKPTKLSEIEFSLIKAHAQRGYEMLKDVESPWPLAEIVYQHHERLDGSGYPRNLKGEAILIEARILMVADVVEAMASHRPYRPGLGIDAALHEIEKKKGLFYEDAVADACLRLFREKGFQLQSA